LESFFSKKSNVRLFERLPENLFSPLARKYRAIYAYALITLYQCMKIYKSRILKSDYMSMLRSNGTDIVSLFNVAIDLREEENDESGVDIEVNDVESADKFAYIVRKLAACGWFQIDKDYKTGEDLIFLPAYSIRLLGLLDQMTSDVSSYMPLVHQTYSELALEDEQEDDYMYRSLANAVKNADVLETSVTLLHHSIVIYNHRLTSVFSPNEALHQHFDDYKKQVGDSIYHPMKTYDSLGLYSRPTITILTRWLRDERIIAKLSYQAKQDKETNGKKITIAEATDLVIESLNYVIDVFERLNKSFDEIDVVNSNYTEAVQRKVNYLSGADKSIKGKLDKVCSTLAKEFKKNPNLHEENSETLRKAIDSIEVSRVGIFDPDSLYMPFRRERREEEEPMGIIDDLSLFDDNGLMNDFLSSEVSQYSEEAVDEFMRKQFGLKRKIKTTDVEINTIDDLILLILAIVKAEFDTSFFTITRIEDKEVISCGYRMPLYELEKRKGN